AWDNLSCAEHGMSWWQGWAVCSWLSYLRMRLAGSTAGSEGRRAAPSRKNREVSKPPDLEPVFQCRPENPQAIFQTSREIDRRGLLKILAGAADFSEAKMFHL